MKIEGYEIIKSLVIPAYWYEEGKHHEEYWADLQNLLYYKFTEDEIELGLIDEDCNAIIDEDGEEIKDTRKWWIITPCKPVGMKITEETGAEFIKWLVADCYMDTENKSTYDFYEWDFTNHCIKKE